MSSPDIRPNIDQASVLPRPSDAYLAASTDSSLSTSNSINKLRGTRSGIAAGIAVVSSLTGIGSIGLTIAQDGEPSANCEPASPLASTTIFESPSASLFSVSPDGSPILTLSPSPLASENTATGDLALAGGDSLTATGSLKPDASGGILPATDTDPDSCIAPTETLSPEKIAELVKNYTMESFLKTKNHAISEKKFEQIITEEAKILFDNQEDMDAYIEVIIDILKDNLHSPHLENTAEGLAATISQAVENAARYAAQGDIEKAEASIKVAQAYRGAELKYIRFDDKPEINTVAEKIKAIDDVTRYYYKKTHPTN